MYLVLNIIFAAIGFSLAEYAWRTKLGELYNDKKHPGVSKGDIRIQYFDGQIWSTIPAAVKHTNDTCKCHKDDMDFTTAENWLEEDEDLEDDSDEEFEDDEDYSDEDNEDEARIPF